MILHQSGFRRTRHRMHICLRPVSHYAGFESELNLQKTATNINFRYFEKKDFVKLPPNFVKLHSHQICCHETEDVHFFACNKHSTELA